MPAGGTLEGVEVVPHRDAAAFAALARPLLDRDPVRHTTTLTVLDAVLHRSSAAACMLTVHDGGTVVGALLRTAGRPPLVSAVPPACAPSVVDTLRGCDPAPGGAQGPVAEAEAFAAAWAARTGESVVTRLRLRLFALEDLRAPAGVPGAARAVGPTDAAAVDLLTAWRVAFEAELDDLPPGHGSPRGGVVRGLRAGVGELVWEVDGEPVAQASARPVVAAMSRIGPVYTPPAHRRRGYAAAVTAAAARWALDRGARDVLLYTDLANATTNRLYPRLGFRPRYDAVELEFTG